MELCGSNTRVQNFYTVRITLRKYRLPDKGFVCILLCLSLYLHIYQTRVPCLPFLLIPFPLIVCFPLQSLAYSTFSVFNAVTFYPFFFLPLPSYLSYLTLMIDLFTKLVKGNTLMLFFGFVWFPLAMWKIAPVKNLLFCPYVKLSSRISKNFFCFDKNNSIAVKKICNQQQDWDRLLRGYTK